MHPRSRSFLAPVAVAALVATAAVGLTACGGDKAAANPWCKTIERENKAFDIAKPTDPRAQDEFARLAAQAPPEIREDMMRIATDARALWARDTDLWLNRERLTEYFETMLRVDDYLRDECGADIPDRQPPDDIKSSS